MDAADLSFFSQAPYPGLRPFEGHETDIFFGRQRQTTELLRRLEQHRFVGVVGTSGSGKSSLVRAGLIAALETGLIAQAGPAWRVAEMRPGSHPLTVLAERLLVALEPERPEGPEALAFLLATLRRGPLGLADVLRETPIPPGTNLLIFVDQFEEIFRFRGDDKASAAVSQPADIAPSALRAAHEEERDRLVRQNESEAFIALLLETLKSCGNVYVLLTMRTDYLGNCTVFQGLPEALNDSQYFIPQLTRDERRQIIEHPARVFGGEVHPTLVARLLNDSPDPGQLPVLQHVLMRMWTQKGRPGAGSAEAPPMAPWELTLDDYERAGTISGSLDLHAGEVYDSLGGQDKSGRKRLAEVMFRALTERASNQRDRRRPLTWPDLVKLAKDADGSEDDLRAVVNAFRAPDCCLLMPPGSEPLDDTKTVDISHESLILHWKILQGWVTDESLAAEKYRQLCFQAQLKEKELGNYLNRLALEDAEKWQRDTQPQEAWTQRYGGNLSRVLAFIQASRTELEREERDAQQELEKEAERQVKLRDQKRKLRNQKIVMTVVAVLAVIALMSWMDATKSADEAKKSEIDATKSLGHALVFKGQLEWQSNQLLSALPYYAAAKEKQVSAPEPAKLPPPITYGYGIEHKAPVQALAIHPDGTWIAAALNNGTIELVKPGTRTPEKELQCSGEAAKKSPLLLAFHPNGQWLLACRGGKEIQMWKVADWTPLADHPLIKPPQGEIKSMTLSPDGSQLAMALNDGSVLARRLDGTETEVCKKDEDEAPDHPTSMSFFRPTPTVLRGVNALVVVRNGKMEIWDTVTKELLCDPDEFDEGSMHVVQVAINPGGAVIAARTQDGILRLWQLESPMDNSPPMAVPASQEKGDKLGKVYPLTFNMYHATPPAKNKDVVASSSLASEGNPNEGQDNNDWSDLDAPPPPPPVDFYHHLICPVAFSRDGETIFWTGDEGYVRSWSWQHRDSDDNSELLPEPLYLRAHPDSVADLALGSDGTWLATASSDRMTRIWHLATPEERRPYLVSQLPPAAAIACTDEGQLVTAGSDENGLRVFLQSTGEVRFLLAQKVDPDEIRLSANGGKVFVQQSETDSGNSVAVWDINTRRSYKILVGGDTDVLQVDVSPCNDVLACPDIAAAKIFFRRLSDGTVLKTAALPPESIPLIVRYSRSGRWMTAFCVDGTMALCELDGEGLPGAALPRSFKTDSSVNEFVGMTFSGDEKTILITFEKAIRMIDLVSGNPDKNPVEVPLKDEMEDMSWPGPVWNWDGRKLAGLRDGHLVVYDLDIGQRTVTESAPLPDLGWDLDEPVTAFFSDGRLAIADVRRIVATQGNSFSRITPPPAASWLPADLPAAARMSGLALKGLNVEMLSSEDEKNLGILATNPQDVDLAEYWNAYWNTIEGLASLPDHGPLTSEQVKVADHLSPWLKAHAGHPKTEVAQTRLESVLSELGGKFSDRGIDLLASQNWAEAEIEFSSSLAAQPLRRRVLACRGFARFKLGREREASSDREAIPQEERASLALSLGQDATQYLRVRRKTSSPVLADIAVWLDPDNPLSLLQRGSLRFYARQYDVAIQDLDAALQKKSEGKDLLWRPSALLLRSRAFLLSSDEKLKQQARNELSALVQEPSNLVGIGPKKQLALALLGRFEEALAELPKVETDNQMRAAIHAMYGASFPETDTRRNREFDKAMETLESDRQSRWRSREGDDPLRGYPEADALRTFHRYRNLFPGPPPILPQKDNSQPN